MSQTNSPTDAAEPWREATASVDFAGWLAAQVLLSRRLGERQDFPYPRRPKSHDFGYGGIICCRSPYRASVKFETHALKNRKVWTMTKAAFWGQLTPPDYRRQMQDWFNRGALENPKTTPLHRRSWWSYLTSRQWQQFVAAILSHVRPRLKDGDSVFESGCGVGALLEEVRRLNPTLRLAGVEVYQAAQ